MFWVSPHPSSGAYNCINSLWFYCWSMVVAALLVMVRHLVPTIVCYQELVFEKITFQNLLLMSVIMLL
jgi:hypothetical protein